MVLPFRRFGDVLLFLLASLVHEFNNPPGCRCCWLLLLPLLVCCSGWLSGVHTLVMLDFVMPKHAALNEIF